jgi:hypothetical protein
MTLTAGVIRKLFSNDVAFAIRPRRAVAYRAGHSVHQERSQPNHVSRLAEARCTRNHRNTSATGISRSVIQERRCHAGWNRTCTTWKRSSSGRHSDSRFWTAHSMVVRSIPHFFTSLGLAVLVYDKRSSGSSTGTYLPRDSYYPKVFLRDAIAAMSLLQSRSDIDSRRVGLWGTSEGVSNVKRAHGAIMWPTAMARGLTVCS